MLSCPRCGIRQYAAVAYVEEPRCVGCETPLDLRRLHQAAVARTREAGAAGREARRNPPRRTKAA